MSTSENTAQVIDISTAMPKRGRKKEQDIEDRRRTGISKHGLTLVGEFAPLIRTNELADWLNYAHNGQSSWDSDRVRDCLTRAGALKKLSEDESYTGSPRRPKAKTSRRTYYTTMDLLSEKLPDFYQALVRAADPAAMRNIIED
jgi:hypothetical protein